jgi:hypothetical protein
VTRLNPEDAFASFDSGSVLHAATDAALRGQRFPAMGQGRLTGIAARLGGHLPWPVLRGIYAQLGANEGLPPNRLGDVDLASVARWFADRYPERRFPAIMLGASNGALTHLAAAMQIPWLPGTVLVPVKRSGDPDDLVAAMQFGAQSAPPLLDANPDIVLHHMHDQAQDELMVAKMAYFRVKWSILPDGYATFLTDRLQPGAPVILIDDTSTWPVLRVNERHVFQSGAQGGLGPHDYLRRPRTPLPDEQAPEAEWGANPDFNAAVAAWCATHGHPLIRITYQGPQAPAHAVATTIRCWYAERGENTQRLIVPSFVLGDPWQTINLAAVPFWTVFSVQPALAALEQHLTESSGYRDAYVMLFEHGVASPGIATPHEWASTLRRHNITPHFLGLRRDKFPHDVAMMGRYATALGKLSPAEQLWRPLNPTTAAASLKTAGLAVQSSPT